MAFGVFSLFFRARKPAKNAGKPCQKPRIQGVSGGVGGVAGGVWTGAKTALISSARSSGAWPIRSV